MITRPVSLLPVPYVSQLLCGASEHHNDCGAACGVMLLAAYGKTIPTVDEFYNRCNPGSDSYLSASQIRTALQFWGVPSAWKDDLGINDLFDCLVNSRPLIALINYGVLVEHGLTEKTSFHGAHFVVVVGIDVEYVYIHDPYTTGSGEALPVRIGYFTQAWWSCSLQGNPDCTALIPDYGIGDGYYEPEYTGKVRVTANALSIRKGAGVNYPVVGYLQKGDVVNLISEHDGWGQIGTNQYIALGKYTEAVSG